MSTAFAAVTLALASFGSFEDAVKEFEACQASAAYGIVAPNTEQFAYCQDIYTGIKLEFVDPALVAEFESLKRKENKTNADYARMHEIGLIGYAGWTAWKEANAEFHGAVVDETMAAARAAVGL